MGKKDQQTGERKTGKDKAKKTFDKYGKYTNKHIRMMEEITEKQIQKQTVEEAKKKETKKETKK